MTRQRFEATIPQHFSDPNTDLSQPKGPRQGHSSLTGAIVDGSVVQELLAVGRSGFYYRLDSPQEIPRAIKFVPVHLAKEEFFAELASKALHHPNIVRVESGGQYRELKIGPLEVFPGDRPSERPTSPASKPSRYRYLILEWVGSAGQTARNFGDLKVEGGIPTQQLCQLAFPIFEALAYAHQQGFVHGKLHPSNLLLTADGLPKVSKFRTASNLENKVTNLAAERASYIAPEQLQRNRTTGASADLYSLAVVLYELLSGHLPHQGNPIIGHLAGESQALPSRDDISSELQAWFEIALQKEACHRFGDMHQAADALRKAL